MALSNNTSRNIALVLMFFSSLFCFFNIWTLVLSNSDTNLFASLANVFSTSLNELYGTKRYLTNLFLLPLIYASLILVLLLAYFVAPSRDRLRKIVFSAFGIGVFLSVISISYADGISFVLIATMIVFFSAISIQKQSINRSK